ncbi:MAG: hypothetical protein GEU95_01145 [Rhizobiales bacterium]|nr:hypothetical protein [Hyphomicrobiales bacterium]
MVGLLPPDQLNVAGYALTAYKRASEDNDLSIAWNFSQIVGGRRATITFIGAWDTVASVLVPRRDRIVPTLLQHGANVPRPYGRPGSSPGLSATHLPRRARSSSSIIRSRLSARSFDSEMYRWVTSFRSPLGVISKNV